MHPRQVAEKITSTAQANDPDQRTNDVVGAELAAAHLGHTGHKRRKGTDERHEARDDDGDAAVTLVKLVRLVKSAFVEKFRLLPLEHLGPEITANRVIALVAEDRRNNQNPHGQRQAQQPRAAQGADNEQQRVTGQERHNHHAGFHKHDQEQQGVHPHAVSTREGFQVFVHVEDEVDQKSDDFHRV